MLTHHDLHVLAGITNSRIIHCDIGDNSAVHNVRYLAHYILGQQCILTSIDEMHNTPYAKFGNGIVKDGELVAGRGFWPGLSTTIRHTSRFASYCLLAKGDYPAELNVRLPFTLVSNDVANNQLVLVPAYWWTHNMYALARNADKYARRAKRKRKAQHIEFDALAPDTVEEVIEALDLLSQWTAQAEASRDGQPASTTMEQLIAQGHTLLQQGDRHSDNLLVHVHDVERSDRPCLVFNPRRAYRAYRQMLLRYAVKNLVAHMQQRKGATLANMLDDLGDTPRETNWTNLGGQLVPTWEIDALRKQIDSGEIDTWDTIHAEYDRWWAAYPRQKQQHGLATLRYLIDGDLTAHVWAKALDDSAEIQRYIRDQVYATRAKDYENPFRQTTFDSRGEREAVAGTVEDNGFVLQVRGETAAYEAVIASLRSR